MNSTDKELRKQKKRMREILELKSKPYDHLNEDQKAKLATEKTVNNKIQFLEKTISKRNNPAPTQTPVKNNIRKNKNKQNKKTKMTNAKLAACKKHKNFLRRTK